MFRLAFVCFLVTTSAFAEERTFSVTVDGKVVGELVLSYRTQKDGSTAVAVRGGWQTPFAYDYRGTETWKDGRLVRLEGSGSDGGRKGGVTLVAGKDTYALKAGAKEVAIRDDVWLTTGAILPDPDGKPFVVDVITGDVLPAKVEKVGADRIIVAGKPVPVTRYRVTAGGQRWDVWYDADQRLAKRAWRREGRALVAELTAIKRD